jgi:hypothetical protein
MDMSDGNYKECMVEQQTVYTMARKKGETRVSQIPSEACAPLI